MFDYAMGTTLYAGHSIALPDRRAPGTAAAVGAPRNEGNRRDALTWRIDPFPTAEQAFARLAEAVGNGRGSGSEWRADDAYLLACGLLGAADERVRGRVLRARRRLSRFRAGRRIADFAEALLALPDAFAKRRISLWRDGLRTAMAPFLDALASGAEGECLEPLAVFLRAPLPPELRGQKLAVASCFRRLDLTPEDFLELAERAAERVGDNQRPVLLLGLRTSGSYMAPLVRARLALRGFERLAEMTLHPDKGPSARESSALGRYAREDYFVVILDDAPQSGGTAIGALDLVRRAGFRKGRAAFCAPTHRSSRGWADDLPPDCVITLAPEQWSQRRFLDGAEIGPLMERFVESRGYARACVAPDADAEAANRDLAERHGRGARLKRVFALDAADGEGATRRLHVLAKSVGWGWYGHGAFVAGAKLSGLTPHLYGFRHGLLFTEWTPQTEQARRAVRRTDWLDAAAVYAAARSQRLSLEGSETPNRARNAPRTALRTLEKSFSHAFGRAPVNLAWRGWLQAQLERQPRGPSTWIDGDMAVEDWLARDGRLLKTDYEHHGLGKAEVNETDPAFDVAMALLRLECTRDEEDRLLRKYVAESGDRTIGERLPFNKLLAGVAAMEREASGLSPRRGPVEEIAARHARLISAWHFLTVQAARQCGDFLGLADGRDGAGALISLDIDGVIDRRVLGFPTATAASLRALAKFRAAGFATIVNTARSLDEVREYCDAYGLRGGVAENGACLWDAAAGRAIVACSEVALEQLEQMRGALAATPGVCLDPRYRHSIRAYLYRENASGGGALERLAGALRPHWIGAWAPGPVPAAIVDHHMSRLKLDRLRVRATSMDTAIVAADVDKGTGLRAFRDGVFGARLDSVAVGDSRSDIPMFLAAKDAFAPAHIDCPREARLAGCRIVGKAFQNGLLQIATDITGIGGRSLPVAPANAGERLFLSLITAADRSTSANLIRALLSRSLYASLLG